MITINCKQMVLMLDKKVGVLKISLFTKYASFMESLSAIYLYIYTFFLLYPVISESACPVLTPHYLNGPSQDFLLSIYSPVHVENH